MATPTPERAAAEILRVLKPGGQTLMMLYHHFSLVGYMLWTRYALMRLRPWTSLREVYANYLESPGMKAYTTEGARGLLSGFEHIETSIYLTHADLLTSPAGQRHRGPLLGLARRLWPRWFFRRFLSGHGLFMTVKAVKTEPG
jgi:hypothetical protein